MEKNLKERQSQARGVLEKKGGGLREEPPGLEGLGQKTCGGVQQGLAFTRREAPESLVTGMDNWRALAHPILRSRKSVFFWKEGVVHSYLASRPFSKRRKDELVP